MNTTYYKHPITGKVVEMESGFNLPVFLLGWIYLFYKGDFETGGIHIFLCILFAFAGVFGLIFLLFLNIWMGYKWNSQYAEHLVEKGYQVIQQ